MLGYRAVISPEISLYELSVFSELINRKFVRNVCFVINRLYMEIYVKMRVEKRSISCMVYELIFDSHFYIKNENILKKILIPYKSKSF